MELQAERTPRQRGPYKGKRWGHHLHVHHIDGNKLNNEPTNLISLCAKCHHDAHRKEVVPT